MKFYHGYLMYDITDEDNMGDLGKSFVREFRVESRDLVVKLCKEFGVNYIPKVEVNFFAGKVDEHLNEIAVNTLGWEMTWFESLKVGKISLSFSLPYIFAEHDYMLDQTLPHEVVHGFTDLFYNKRCDHGIEWEEFMEYLGLPAKQYAEISLSSQESARKFVDMPQIVEFKNSFFPKNSEI